MAAATMAFGVAALSIAAVLVVVRSVNLPAHTVWPALVFLLPLVALMIVQRARRGLVVTVAHLAVGAVSIGFFAWIVVGRAPEVLVESPFLLALPQLALVYTVAPTVRGVGNLVAIGVAYLLGQAAVLTAAVSLDRYPSFDWFTAALTAVLLAVGVTDVVSTRRSVRDRKAVERARRAADADAYQREVEEQVVALFHDTVLGELTVLAHRPPGLLAPALREALERDLALIERGSLWPEGEGAGAGSASDAGGAASVPGRTALVDAIPLPGPIADAITAGRRDGLRITLAGDLASLQRIDEKVGDALGLAVQQALVNVRMHAGTEQVEIVVDGAADEVVMMISDAGTGFEPADVPPGRLGVVHSIVARIQGVGGRVQLFTSPGSGTAYLFSLPPTPANSWPRGEEGDG